MKQSKLRVCTLAAALLVSSLSVIACNAAEPGTQTAVETKTETRTESKNETETEASIEASMENQTPYALHGNLHVTGTKLCDQKGDPFVCKGVSTHGIAWFPQYVQKDAFQEIRDWGGNCVRLALYTEEYGGYVAGGNQAELEQKVDEGILAATELGMYVILDWHILSDGNPETHQAEALDFFQRMSKKYQDYGNLIYELCNEPNGAVTWPQVKQYAEAVIPVIRSNAPGAVILVGSPTWSQDVDLAAADPIQADNVMVTLHFYAGTHGAGLRNKAEQALQKGLPLFVSEYGLCDASGNGAVAYEEAAKWAAFLDENQISYIQWALANKNETCSLLRLECQKLSGWTDEDLTESGLWVKKRLGE